MNNNQNLENIPLQHNSENISENKENFSNLATPTFSINKRDSNNNEKLINLDKFYNHSLDDDIHNKKGNNLSSLPKGLQRFGNTLFDIRGVVQLAGTNSEEITHLIYPKEAKDIEINQKAYKIHFLQASSWNIEAPKKLIGKYIVYFENKSAIEINLIYEENIWDWWGHNLSSSNETPIWKGSNERTEERNMHIRLFKFTWENPFPDSKIIKLDFVSNINGPGPFLVALTIE